MLTLRLSEHRRAHVKPTTVVGPSKGAQLTILDLETDTKERLQLTFPRDRPAVLYAVRTDCSWCTSNLSAFSEVVEAVSSTFDVLVIDIGVDPLTANERFRYREDSAVIDGQEGPFRIVPGFSGWRFGGTPHTIVLDRDGRVTETWLGAYVGNKAKEIGKFFGFVFNEPIQTQD